VSDLAVGAPPVLLKSENLPVVVEPEALQKQIDVLSAMRGVEIEYSRLGPVSQVIGRTGVELPRSVREFREGSINTGLLDGLGPMLLATGREALVVKSNRYYGSSREIETEQTIRGIPVVGGLVTASIDETSGEVLAIVAAFLPDRGLPRKPKLSADQAWQALVRVFEASGDASPGSLNRYGKPSLAYHAHSDPLVPRLVWEFQAYFTCPTGRQDSETVWLDAIDGTVVGRIPNGSYNVDPGPCQKNERQEADCVMESAPRDSMAASCAIEAPPTPTVERIGCSNQFQLTWPRAPGAYRYYVQRAPRNLGWPFARTVTQWFAHQCTITVDSPTMVRMQVCGRCGECGAWSETAIVDPQAACGPAD
jgi:hypothetical protein